MVETRQTVNLACGYDWYLEGDSEGYVYRGCRGKHHAIKFSGICSPLHTFFVTLTAKVVNGLKR